MRRLITSIIVCFVAIAAMAQNRAEIIVSYECEKPNKQGRTATSRMSLLASPNEAKYFNDVSLWTDSLKSTPEGKEQWQQIIMAACMTKNADGGVTFDMRKGPVKKIYDYIFTRLSDNQLRHYTKLGDEEIYYDESLSEMEWEPGDSIANILGYDCQSAVTDYHGRKWTAWFTTDIPVSFGPWKFHGLPGLILKVEADGGFSFTATGVEKTERIITPMYSPDLYDRKERKKALADEEYYINNKEAIIKSKYDNVEFLNKTEEPKYDASRFSLEPDYKE